MYLRCLCLVLTLGTATLPALGERFMTRQDLREVDQLAVCNDGSTGLYYYRRGQGEGRNRYLLLLPHAESQADDSACQADRCGLV